MAKSNVPSMAGDFDRSGANCRVPWNPDAKRDRLGAIALPVREIAGLLWLYTGFEPSAEPEPSETFAAQKMTVCAQSAVWNVHWTRVMENMLDMPHLPFVHRSTIGKDLNHLTGGARMELFLEERSYGARISNAVDGIARPGALEYRFPNIMELFIDPPGRLLRLMVACIPEDEKTHAPAAPHHARLRALAAARPGVSADERQNRSRGPSHRRILPAR